MNKAGYKFIELINMDWKRLLPEQKFNFDDSRVYERLMRMGLEHLAFKPLTPGESRSLALATLKQDVVKNEKATKLLEENLPEKGPTQILAERIIHVETTAQNLI